MSIGLSLFISVGTPCSVKLCVAVVTGKHTDTPE